MSGQSYEENILEGLRVKSYSATDGTQSPELKVGNVLGWGGGGAGIRRREGQRARPDSAFPSHDSSRGATASASSAVTAPSRAAPKPPPKGQGDAL